MISKSSRRQFLGASLAFGALARRAAPAQTSASPFRLKVEDVFVLEEYSHRCFRFFVEQSDPETGLVMDRAGADGLTPHGRVASLAATGFGLTALCIGAQRGWISPNQARDRVYTTLQFLRYKAYQTHGFFYHFMDASSGEPRLRSEISSIDTALCLAGALTASEFFSKDNEIRSMAHEIFNRVDFAWMLNGDPALLSHGYNPGKGFLPYRWDQYSEASILYLLAIGSATHPISPRSWYAWKRPWVRYRNYSFISGGPLFTHQFSHAWVDFRNLRDADSTDFFHNSVMATYAHRNFCLSLKSQFPSFGPNLWGITVSDSPLGYVSWGGPPVQGPINGTIVPCATVGSAMLAPEICLPVVRQMLTVYGDTVYQRYGFADAFTPHWQGETLWVDPDVVGIDVGISLLSVENLQSGNVWRWFMRNPYIRSGMQKARFHRSIGTSLDEWNQRMAASKEDQE